MEDPQRAPRWRYNIATLLSGTTAVACMLAYLKRFEPEEFGKGLAVVALTSLLGVALGMASRRYAETIFWTVMGAMSAFLCAVGEPLTHASFQVAWPIVGALTAGTAIVLDRYALATRMLVGAGIGFTVLAIFSMFPARHTWIEVSCGPVAGAIMVGVVWLLETLRSWRNYSRSFLAVTLTVGVIGGNLFGRMIGVL